MGWLLWFHASGPLGEKAQLAALSTGQLIKQSTLHFASIFCSCFLPVVALSFHSMIEQKVPYHLDVFARHQGHQRSTNSAFQISDFCFVFQVSVDTDRYCIAVNLVKCKKNKMERHRIIKQIYYDAFHMKISSRSLQQ